MLLSFSLPYQAGCDRAFTQLRTLCHTPEKGIVDGQRAYDSSKALSVSTAWLLKDAAANIPRVVIQSQIERFRMQMSAVDMDYDESDASVEARRPGGRRRERGGVARSARVRGRVCSAWC